jgi:hypothetical protein
LKEEIKMQEMTMDEVESVHGGITDFGGYLLFWAIAYCGSYLGWWEIQL